MPSNAVSERQLSQLLWRHFRWHLWVGLVIWAGVMLMLNLVLYAKERYSILHDNFYAQLPASSTANAVQGLINRYAQYALYGLLLGLCAATIGGLIRHPFLAYLTRRARTRRELLRGSLLLFVASICLVSLIPFPVAYNKFSAATVWRQLRLYAVLGWPWFMTTWLASRKLAAALALPDEAD